MPAFRSSLLVITFCLCLFAGPVQLHAAQDGAPPQLDALFLGPRAESADLLRELLQGIVGEQSAWRQGFHPTDRSLITPQTLASPEAAATRSNLKQQLSALSTRLQANSNPWFSPRYLGHMNSDLLLPAVAGYVSAMLYNQNNVVYEGGPATTEIELEVAVQLAGLLGYDPATFWGNLTAGGSTANFQALWFARNLKSFPLAVKAVMPELVKGLSQQQLQNLPVDRILQLVDQVKTDRRYEAVLARTVKGKGVASAVLGKVLVPQSRHYSWDKAADLLGLGNEAIITVPVDRQYRMDVAALDRIIADLAKRKIPVLAVVSVLGSTEEGAIDETDRIAALQKKYAARGIGFFYHIDAAYGGYLRSMFIQPTGRFMTLDEARATAVTTYGIPAAYGWPAESVYRAFKAVPEADSVTIDPHKLGYIPYPAGAVLFKDKRMMAVQSFHAAYVQDLRKKAPTSVGHYTLEGSKPGAAAAAVWTAHQVVSLNELGYGRLLGRTVKATALLYEKMLTAGTFTAANGRGYRIIPLVKPDTNMLDYVVKEEGNQSLTAMNRLNQQIYDHCSYVSGNLMEKDIVLSKTVFSPAEYGDVPLDFIRRCGMLDNEWRTTRSVLVLRTTMMSPFLADETVLSEYFDKLVGALKKAVNGAGR